MRGRDTAAAAAAGSTGTGASPRDAHRSVAGVRGPRSGSTPRKEGPLSPVLAPSAPVPDAAIKLRIYDQYNLICVGVPSLKFQ
jgi:hypothetical protein